jgi:hypothetical protein
MLTVALTVTATKLNKFNMKCLLKPDEDDDVLIPVNSYPFNPNFDGIINPGMAECKLPGTVTFAIGFNNNFRTTRQQHQTIFSAHRSFFVFILNSIAAFFTSAPKEYYYLLYHQGWHLYITIISISKTRMIGSSK